jgi:hypothetical protein
MSQTVKIPKGLIRSSNLNGVTLFNGQKNKKKRKNRQTTVHKTLFLIYVFMTLIRPE